MTLKTEYRVYIVHCTELKKKKRKRKKKKGEQGM